MKNAYSFVFFSILLLATVANSSTAAQLSMDQEIVQEAQKATDIINSNQILKLWQNESTHSGIGVVQDVSCKLEELGKGQTIFTYAELLVEVPLTDNLNSEQIVVAKYLGGQTDNLTLTVDMLWPYFLNDTVTPPSMFDLSKGQTVMFFIKEPANTLSGYIPYATTETRQEPLMLLSSEPHPTTPVQESEGYGFETKSDCRHIDWSDMPWQYQIDPDGTPDIAGDAEFSAIQAAFSTWENAPCCGVDFTEGNRYNPGNYWQNYSVTDDHNSIGWVSTFDDHPLYPLALGLTWARDVDGKMYETDVVLNDEYDWTLDAEATWWDGSDIDAQSTLTHEIGHVIGLSDLTITGNEDQTMWYQADYGNSKRTLDWGDLNGAHYLYPVHNDGGSGGDGSNTFSGATLVQRNEWYYGRLCRLPPENHTLDTVDYFKFYAVQGQWITIVLNPPDNADFDLELYNPSAYLVAYSRQDGSGIQEVINIESMEASGYWRIRICTSETSAKESNGQYGFKIYDYLSRYVSSIEYSGAIWGLGGAYDEQNMIGSSPDGNYAIIYGYYGAGTIVACLNNEMTTDSYVYFYGYSWTPTCLVHVYVSLNYNYDWRLVNSVLVYEGPPSTIYVGSTSGAYRYIAFAVYSETDPASLCVDCVIATP